MRVILCFIVGYFIGGINPAYVIGRLSGFDIRQHGSGNAGASNVIILKGKTHGAFVALFDILKAYFAIVIARSIAPTFSYAGELTGAATILGHIYPVALGFKGGKGLACLGGTILALNWKLFVALLFSEAILLLLTKYLCYVPISASIFFPIIHAYKLGSFIPIFIFLPIAASMFYKHIENLRRISKGEEVRISFLWNKEEELARIGISEDDYDLD